MATPVSFDPSTWNSSTAAPFTIGSRYSYLGREFRYVKNYTDAAIADGDVCVWQSATDYVATGASRTSALGGATTLGGPPAGVGVGAISSGNYGFLLARGRHTNVKGVATITLKRLQRASSTAVSGDDVSNAYDAPFGVALTTVSGGRYTVEVNI